MTESTRRDLDLRSLKTEARRLAREPDGPSYCQALDGLARETGHLNWKTLNASQAAQGRNRHPVVEASVQVSEAAARSSSRKLNAWVSSAIDLATRSRVDPIAFRSVLRERGMTYDERAAAASKAIDHRLAASMDARETAALLVAAIAHDALVDDDASLMPWRIGSRALVGDDVLRVVEGMWSAGPAPRPEDPQDDGAWRSRIETSTSVWFSRMASTALARGRSRLAELLVDLAGGTHERRIEVLELVRPLRLLLEADRAAFETMIAERYAARTSRPVDDHREDARTTLDAHLDDERIAFGDDGTIWDRELADALADVDMEHWEP